MKRILLKKISRTRSLDVTIQDLVLSRTSMILPIFLLLKLELVVRDGTVTVFVGCTRVTWAIFGNPLLYSEADAKQTKSVESQPTASVTAVDFELSTFNVSTSNVSTLVS